MLQGDRAPDLFGIRSKRSADYTLEEEGPLEIEECFIDPNEIQIKYERRLVSNRLREYDSQSCYDDVIITGVSEDLKDNKGRNQSAKLLDREGRQLRPSSFANEPIYKAFPDLNSRPLTDRWAWLNYPKRDDGMCVATLPGKIIIILYRYLASFFKYFGYLYSQKLNYKKSKTNFDRFCGKISAIPVQHRIIYGLRKKKPSLSGSISANHKENSNSSS